MDIKFADSMMTSFFCSKQIYSCFYGKKMASHATSNRNSMKPSCKQGDRLKKNIRRF